MQNEVKGLLALGASLGLFGGITPASASSNYSAARSNSVRLVWRHSMGQYSYTATRGARYSAHLGVRYGANAATPNQVWYTNAHEKLYDRSTHRNLIYYHVNNGDYTSGGWIWRGYLKAAPVIAGGSNAVKTPVAVAPATVPLARMNLDALYQSPQHAAVNPADATVMQLFPTALYDQRVYVAANSYLNLGDDRTVGEYDPNTAAEMADFKHLLNNVPNRIVKVVTFEARAPYDAAAIDRALSRVGYPAKVRAGYHGWYVGGGVLAISADEADAGEYPGEGIVLLVKE
ncbi:hypothetical protein ACS4N0_07345 [Levilactobacillus zymae]|uniref:hypothetical protein n=1 Tax=Levilactobacillus zymae TaxID=267363 RepID=UPI003FCE8B01